jgi:ATP-dependent DNA helicase RecG
VPRGKAESLDDFLDALKAPFKFVSAAPGTAARARIPGRALAARARTVRAGIGDTRTRAHLTELSGALEACEGVTGDELQQHVTRCRAIVERMRGAADDVAPPYRATTRDFTEDLKGLDQSVQFVPGVGPRRADLLRKMGLNTVEDLLYHMPFRYEDRRLVTTVRGLRIGESGSVRGELVHLAERHVGRTQRRILEGVLRDDTGLLALTWFHQVAYFRSRYRVGQRYLVHGKVEGALGSQKRIVHPEMHDDAEMEGQGVLPIYIKPTTMSVAVMRGIAQGAVRLWASRLPSVLPAAVAAGAGVTDLQQAMEMVHCPAREADVDALNAFRSAGHRSIVFDELFFMQLGMALRRRSVEMETGLAQPERGLLTRRFYELLPFKLTPAQQRVTREILADMAAPRPLHRLVQGDVGSGKTIVALIAALVAIENGRQAAFMAPTELLAEQHFNTIRTFTEPLELKTELLTGQLTRAQRRRVYDRIASGEVQLAVGTHALIQEGVQFRSLGLGVIDEQHRFGVLQRAALRRMGGSTGAGGVAVTPDILLMTATPIPRTLAMAVYGDLDISVIDQMPPGRKPVRTFLFSESQRAAAYDRVKRELDRGHQAYVVYPLVESSELSELRDATTMARELARAVFHQYRVGLIHGKMKGAEKDAVMRRFKAGDVQLLVSTTVIEVGIDVANATVMVIEHADRFGLAQLHQLRGRVGRGADESHCLLIAPFLKGDDAYRRLSAMTRTNDGFKIADIDLELRGPGEMLGTRQSGLPDFRVANIIRDRALLEQARRAVDAWLERDPRLTTPESAQLRRVLIHRWAGRLELADIG